MSKQLTVFFVNARSQVLTSELPFHLCVLLYFLNVFCCLYTDALVIVSCLYADAHQCLRHLQFYFII